MATGGASETGGASDIERGTDETFDNLCSPCSRRNKNIEGSKYCTDCQDYFCSSCVNWHNEFPAIRNHQILDTDSLSLMKVKNSKEYSTIEFFIKGDGCYAIESICELDDGTIILSDSGNNKLKRLDSSYMVRDSCRVPRSPRQVCTINSHEVAVCCKWETLIQFVSIGLTMQQTRQIATGFHCVGLAYNNEKLFICDDFPSVYVYTRTGERLQQFNKPGLFSRLFMEGKNNFTYLFACRIAVSSDGSTIYISHYEKGLIILNSNGQLVGEFTDSKLRGVCLYKNNSVLGCGVDANNVLQFTSDGKLIGEVLKRARPCHAICYCKNTSKLILGIGAEIEEYDISE